jgi:hypothetical protein
MESAVYKEKSVKQSELLQVLLLDAVYAQKGSEKTAASNIKGSSSNFR